MVAGRSKHIPSVLLSDEENTMVVQALGQKRYSVATAVAEVHMALPNNRAQWTKQHTGVVCLVKDGALKSYFIRLIDVKQKAIAWEQELYKQFKYRQATSTFHTFNGDECRVGINFCNEQEAAAFRARVKERIRDFRRKREEARMKRLKQQQMMMMSGALIPHPSGRGFIRVHNIPAIGSQASRGPRGPPMMGRQMSMMRPQMSGIMPQMSGMVRPGRAGGMRPSPSMMHSGMRFGPPFPRRPMMPGMRGGPPPNWGHPSRGPPQRYPQQELQPGQHPSGQFMPGGPPPGHPPMRYQASGQFYPGHVPPGTPPPGGMMPVNAQTASPQGSQSPQSMHRPPTPSQPKEVKTDVNQQKSIDQQSSDEKKKKKGFFSMFKKGKSDLQEPPESKQDIDARAETSVEEQEKADSAPVSIPSEFVSGNMIVGVDESGEIYSAAECETLLAAMAQKEGVSADEIFEPTVELEPAPEATPQAPTPISLTTEVTTIDEPEKSPSFAPPPPPPPPPPPMLESLSGSDFSISSPRLTASTQSGGLMESILAGKQLKKVDKTSIPPPASSNTMAGMGGALARALDERSKVMHSSDEEDFEDDEDWEDDDDEDWSD